MIQHLRNWLLFSGYCILPCYLISRYTFVGYLSAHFITTLTSVVSALLVGAMLYVTSLIYSNLTCDKFDRSPHFGKLVVLWLVLLSEFLCPYMYYLGPYSLAWQKAYVLDCRRAGQEQYVTEMAQKAKGLFTNHPKLYDFIYGSPKT